MSVSYDPPERSLCFTGRDCLPGVPRKEGNIMKIDWYTKTILTIIAACLVWMCVRSAGETVLAQARPQPQPQRRRSGLRCRRSRSWSSGGDG